jgi:uncharacterized repeat protein (TIGR03803 family)
VIRDSSGYIYGTTYAGGAFGHGVVYKLDPQNASLTVLYSFPADGGNTLAVLFRDTSENLYGTTPVGGKFGSGIVFKVDTSGRETVLYKFTGGADGSLPVGISR